MDTEFMYVDTSCMLTLTTEFLLMILVKIKIYLPLPILRGMRNLSECTQFIFTLSYSAKVKTNGAYILLLVNPCYAGMGTNPKIFIAWKHATTW